VLVHARLPEVLALEEDNELQEYEEDEAVEELEEVIEEDEVRVEDLESVVGTPEAEVKLSEQEALVILNDNLKWLVKMKKLEKALIEDYVTRVDLRNVIEQEIKEVRKEIERSLWKIGFALAHLSSPPPLPEELINRALAATRGPEPKGASNPWLIVELLKRYKV